MPIMPVIEVTQFGNMCAVTICLQKKIKSPNDKEELGKAKKQIEGFTERKFIVGEFEGRKVQEVKPLIRRKLLETGEVTSFLFFKAYMLQ